MKHDYHLPLRHFSYLNSSFTSQMIFAVRFVISVFALIREDRPLMMLMIVFLLRNISFTHTDIILIVKLLQYIYICEHSASSCYLPELSKGLDPYDWELHVGRAKGFIVAKGDDTKLPTPESQTKEYIY